MEKPKLINLKIFGVIFNKQKIKMDIDILFNDSIPFENQKLLLLEQVVKNMYSGDPTKMMESQQILEKLEQNTNFWLRVDKILENSKNRETIFFSLQSLQKGVQTKWDLLSDDEKKGIRSYIENFMSSLLNDENMNSTKKTYLYKINSILVEVIKKELTHNWKTALSDLSKSALKSQKFCENVLLILKELSIEIFDFWKNSITSQEIQNLKQTFSSEFKSVFDLCMFVLKSYLSDPVKMNVSLISTCLETIQAFLSWMPIYYVFMTDLCDLIILNFISKKRFTLVALKCLEEIWGLDIIKEKNDLEKQQFEQIQSKIISGFENFLNEISKIYTVHHKLEIERLTILKNDQLKDVTQFKMFCQNLSLVILNFFQTHIEWVEKVASQNRNSILILENLKNAIQYIGNLTEVKDKGIFKSCVEFWIFFTNYYKKIHLSKNDQTQVLNLNQNNNLLNFQREIYKSSILNHSIMQLILKMPRPKEVNIFIDEDGLPKEQTYVNTENSSLYNTMREIFRNFAILNWGSLNEILKYKLDKQIDGSEFSYNNLNSFCWTAGCLSNVLNINEEKNFFISILRALLGFVQKKTNTEDKIVIATCIMHIVSQYERFLKQNPDFLNIVIKKLFEFMREKFNGVRSMACNIFLKIAKNAKHCFKYNNNKMVEDIIIQMPDLLDVLQHNTFYCLQLYEGVSHMISVQNNPELETQLIYKILNKIQNDWENINKNCNNPNFLSTEQNTQMLNFYLRINEKVCLAAGHSYINYFDNNFQNITKIYENYLQLINQTLKNNGIAALNFIEVKKYRGVRKNILNLLQTFVSKNHGQQNFVKKYQNLLTFALQLYNQEDENIREPEMLLYLSKAIDCLKNQMVELSSEMIPLLLQSILPMITKDFSSFPETRQNFFKLIQSLVKNAFPVFLNIPAEIFKTIIDCVIWAFKHELPLISEIGLKTLNTILESVCKNENFMNQFFKFYYIQIITDVLYVLTDELHINGFSLQSKTIFLLINALNGISVDLLEGDGDNKIKVFNYVLNIMIKNFGNLAKNDHQRLLRRVFEASCEGKQALETGLRDYLVSLKIYTKNDQDI